MTNTLIPLLDLSFNSKYQMTPKKRRRDIKDDRKAQEDLFQSGEKNPKDQNDIDLINANDDLYSVEGANNVEVQKHDEPKNTANKLAVRTEDVISAGSQTHVTDQEDRKKHNDNRAALNDNDEGKTVNEDDKEGDVNQSRPENSDKDYGEPKNTEVNDTQQTNEDGGNSQYSMRGSTKKKRYKPIALSAKPMTPFASSILHTITNHYPVVLQDEFKN